MSAFDKISASQIGARRRLFDYQVNLSGTEAQVVLLKLDINKYQDREISIVDHFLTSIIFDIPGEIPIDRLRKDVSVSPATTQSVFLYDIIPIQIYTKFEDNVERGDVLVQKIFMDNDAYYMVLQVADTLGNLIGRQITYKKQNAAPYTDNLTPEVQRILDNYKLF
jgi:hypothetical protein